MARRKSNPGPASQASSPTSVASFDLGSADRPFDNILNFRDVGSSVNKIYGSR